MKNVSFAFLTMMVVVLASCTKNDDISTAEDQVITNELEAYQSATFELINTATGEVIEAKIPVDCVNNGCTEKIGEWMDTNQPIADGLCETQWEDISCCIGEDWKVVRVIARPSIADCGYQSAPYPNAPKN